MTGTTISHYRVLEKLGSGGMGLVYRAEDLRLKRFVALKVLSDQLAQDAQALHRFQREAEAASALNHPNICTIYDVDQEAGRRFIVMELLEGQPLAEKIGASALPVDAVIDLGIQVADALDAAHSAGIIHRDLKPANIFVNKRGQAKILDFGLAKLLADTADVLPDAPTMARETLTTAGTTLGTVAYMSPEQVSGDELDPRSDLFALGAVLYEMASGKRPFAARSIGLIQEAILNRNPVPVSQLNPDIPERLETIIDRALEKDRSLRYQTAADLRADLKRLRTREESMRSHVSRGSRPVPSVAHGSAVGIRPRTRAVLGASAVVAAIAAAIVYSGSFSDDSGPSARLLPFTGLPGLKRQAALSPEGSQIAFAWNGGDGEAFSLYVKIVGAGPELRLTTTTGVDSNPTWSPDSRYIAFHRQLPSSSGYYIVPALGGQEQKVAASHTIPVSLGRTIDWSPDGRSLVVADSLQQSGALNLLMISVEDGKVRPLLREPAPYLYSPAFSPDGKYLAYIAGTDFLAQDVFVVPLGGGPPMQLTVERKHLAGLAWTPDGRRIVFSSNRAGLFSLWEVPATGGQPTRVTAAGEDAQSPVISRRGDRLAYVRMQADWNIWRAATLPSSDEVPARVVASTRDDWQPEYSPTREKLAFVSTRSGSREIWVANADGTRPVQLTDFRGAPTGTPRWSPDGQRIAFDSRAAGHASIFVVGRDGGSPVRLTEDAAENMVPSWSSDGRWIYFASNRDGSEKVWKVSSGGGVATRVTEHGGRNAVESRDGRFLYYWREGWIYRQPLAGGLETRIAQAGEWGHWVVRPQGIFILVADASPKPVIDLVDPETGDRQRVTTLERWPRISSPPSFDVSRDGLWTLFARVDHIDNDVMVVENFR